MIEVKMYDEGLKNQMIDFCQRINIPNWNFDRLNLNKITYFCAIYNNKIISINGVRHIKDKTWAGYTRLATDPKYFRLIKVNKSTGSLCTIWCGSSIPLRYLSKPSIEYCLSNGATQLIAYCNVHDEEGMNNSKNRKHYFRLVDVGLLDYDGIEYINGVQQDKFILNHEKIIHHIDEGWKITNLEFRNIE